MSFSSTTPFGYGVYAVIFACLTLAFFVNRRVSKEVEGGSGCLGALYTGLIVFAISSLFAGSLFMFATMSNAFIFHPKYEALIVDVSSEWVEQDYTDSDGDRQSETVKMYTAILEFTDESGVYIKSPNSVSSGREPVIGRTIWVAYKNGELTEFSIRTGLGLIAVAGVVILFGFLVTGMMFFAAYKNTDRIKTYGLGFLFYIVIPAAMFAFMMGLFYGLYDHYANSRDMPIWAQVVALFFGVVMFFVLWGYLKFMLGKEDE